MSGDDSTARARPKSATLTCQRRSGPSGSPSRAGACRRQPEQHVLRLDVAVDHADAVRRSERAQHRLQDVGGFGHRQRPLLGEPAPQRRPGDQLHHQEHAIAGRAAVGALVGDRDGVWRGQLRRRFGLPVKPGDEQRIPGERRMHDLHRNRPVESSVDSGVDRGHAAGGEPVADLVAAVEQDPDQGIGDRRVHDRSLWSASRRRRPQNPPSCACRCSAYVLNRAGIRRRSSCRALRGSPAALKALMSLSERDPPRPRSRAAQHACGTVRSGSTPRAVPSSATNTGAEAAVVTMQHVLTSLRSRWTPSCWTWTAYWCTRNRSSRGRTPSSAGSSRPAASSSS